MNWSEIISIFGTGAVVLAAWNMSARLAAMETEIKWIKDRLEKL